MTYPLPTALSGALFHHFPPLATYNSLSEGKKQVLNQKIFKKSVQSGMNSGFVRFILL
jgi:hypothetical protein